MTTCKSTVHVISVIHLLERMLNVCENMPCSVLRVMRYIRWVHLIAEIIYSTLYIELQNQDLNKVPNVLAMTRFVPNIRKDI